MKDLSREQLTSESKETLETLEPNDKLNYKTLDRKSQL